MKHTKHALEALHPNIRVFRHPDHYPSGLDIEAELMKNFHNLSLRTFDIAKASGDAVKTLYGTSDDVGTFNPVISLMGLPTNMACPDVQCSTGPIMRNCASLTPSWPSWAGWTSVSTSPERISPSSP